MDARLDHRYVMEKISSEHLKILFLGEYLDQRDMNIMGNAVNSTITSYMWKNEILRLI